MIIWKKLGDYIVRKGETSRPYRPKAKGQLAAVSAFTQQSPQLGNRYPGDPGVGNFYFGGREDQLTMPKAIGAPGLSDSEQAIARWESRMAPWSGGGTKGKLGIIRLYGSASLTTGFDHTSDMTRHYNAGRIPHISFKFPDSWGNLDAASAKAMLFDADWDRWMNALAAQMLSYAPKPVWWTFFHEPEDFSTATLASRYRAICRRMKQSMDAHGVTNHTYINSCMQAPYNYGGGGGTRDWRWWYADWKGTSTNGGGHTGTKDDPNPVDFYLEGDPNSVVDVIGLDVYHWWNAARYAGQDPTNHPDGTAVESLSKYYTFTVMWERIKARNDFLGKTYLMGEWGIEAYHTGIWYPPEDGRTSTAVFDDALTLSRLKEMFDLFPSYRIVAIEVYNYALTHQPWRLEWGDTNRARYHGYGLGMARTNCVRPDFD